MGVIQNKLNKSKQPTVTKVSAAGKGASSIIHKAHVLSKKEVEMNRSSAYSYAF